MIIHALERKALPQDNENGACFLPAYEIPLHAQMQHVRIQQRQQRLPTPSSNKQAYFQGLPAASCTDISGVLHKVLFLCSGTKAKQAGAI